MKMKYSLRSSILIIFGIFLASASMGEKSAYKAGIDSDGVQRIEVLAGGYFFNPDHIIVSVNIPVELKIKKEAGIVPHAFVIKEPGAGIDINESLSTEPKVIRFTPKKVGKYTFYCDKKLLFFESHRKKGMAGILEVTE